MALLFQHVEREGDVGRGDLRPVEKSCFGPQPKPAIALVARNAHRLREQPIDRIGLVAVGGHQRVEGRAHAGRAVALPAVDVERVESFEVLVAAGSGDLKREEAPGRRLRVGVGEMREIRRQRQIAERRQAVRLDRIVVKRGERARKERRQPAAGTNLQSRPACESLQHRTQASRLGAIYRARRLIASESGENEAQPGSRCGVLPRAGGSRISPSRNDSRFQRRRSVCVDAFRDRPCPFGKRSGAPDFDLDALADNWRALERRGDASTRSSSTPRPARIFGRSGSRRTFASSKISLRDQARLSPRCVDSS